MFRRRRCHGRRANPTDLTDAQWVILEPLVPPPKTGGRPPAHLRRDDGTWERINTALRERVRARAGRKAQPSGAIIDSQSAKTRENGGLGAMTAARR